jgi:hypothetical protein
VAEAPRLAREGDDAFGLRGAVWIHTAQAQKTETRIPAAEELLEEALDAGMEGAVGRAQALVVDLEELIEVVLDDLLEVVLGALGPVARGGGRGAHGEP